MSEQELYISVIYKRFKVDILSHYIYKVCIMLMVAVYVVNLDPSFISNVVLCIIIIIIIDNYNIICITIIILIIIIVISWQYQ